MSIAETELDDKLHVADPSAIERAMKNLMAVAHSGLTHGYQSQNLSCSSVCTGCWATTVLLETGIISSPDEVSPYSHHIRVAREAAGLSVK